MFCKLHGKSSSIFCADFQFIWHIRVYSSDFGPAAPPGWTPPTELPVCHSSTSIIFHIFPQKFQLNSLVTVNIKSMLISIVQEISLFHQYYHKKSPLKLTPNCTLTTDTIVQMVENPTKTFLALYHMIKIIIRARSQPISQSNCKLIFVSLHMWIYRVRLMALQGSRWHASQWEMVNASM